MTYRDAVPRLSIAQVRTRFLPRVFRQLQHVEIEHAGVVYAVGLIDVVGQGPVRTVRRMACPRCKRAVVVLGHVESLGWVCRGCGGWRSRNRLDRKRCGASR